MRSRVRGTFVCAAAALAIAGCGRVHFVPAPFTPDSVELVYDPSEDLSRLRFHVADTDGVSLELRAGDGTWAPIDFAGAVYPSGSWSCTGGTCYQLVQRGRIPLPDSGGVVRGVQPDYGTFVAGTTKLGAAPAVPVGFSAALEPAADQLDLTISDWLSAPGLGRRFALTVWPEDSAPCDPQPARADDAVTVGPDAERVAFTQPLTPAGRYCARVRPQPADGGARPALVLPVLTLPDVFREEHDYSPPIETAPVVWRLISDYEIVDPDRCATVGKTVHDAWAAALGGHELTALDLSPGCAQSDNRAFDGAALADDAKTYLAANYPNRYQEPLLVYADNLAAQLPGGLVASLDDYLFSFQDPNEPTYTVGMVSGGALTSFQWTLALQFVAIEDPQFQTTISDFVRQILPFKTQIHDDGQILPLMPQQTVQDAAGDPWKVCQASPAITRFLGDVPVDFSIVAPPIDPQNPPGFSVVLPPQILVPAPTFAPTTVVIRYEICRRWCDHPYQDQGGGSNDSWLSSPVCVRNTVP
jgi:hypothetical protein